MYNFFKRLLDITVSLLALIILITCFYSYNNYLRLSAEGEVFYFQERYGIHNSRFQIWKFATMLKNSMNMVLVVLRFKMILELQKLDLFKKNKDQ